MGILRLLLAIAVIVAHIGPLFGLELIGGAMAVQSFFIISGFYMAMVVNEKYVGRNGSFKLFISNRLLRIYPLYLIVLVLSILFCVYVSITGNQGFPVIDNYRSVAHGFSAYIFMGVVHLIIIGQDAVMFTGIDVNNGHLFFASNFWATSPPLYAFLFVQQAWSLSLEIMFYLIAPLILARGTKWILPLLMLTLVIRVIIYYYLNLQNDPWTYRFFPSELFFFLLGYFSYRFYKSIANHKISWFPKLLTLAIVISFTVSYTLLPSLSGSFIFQYSIKDVLYFMMIVLSIPILFIASKNIKYDRKIGELSYPVYLSHLLIAKIVWLFNNEFMHSTFFIVVATILFSYILTVAVAVPIEKYRQKRLGDPSPQHDLSNIKSKQLA